jgi:NADH-quinone oxidoreductase subunit N
VLVYFFAYLVSNAGAFAVAALYRDETSPIPSASSRARAVAPLCGRVFALCLFSLAGIPATAEFIGKFFVFKASIDAGSMRSRSSAS